MNINLISHLLVILLFVVALYFFIGRIVLHIYLVKRGEKVVFGLSGLPFYLENIYAKSGIGVRNPKMDRFIFSLKISMVGLMTIFMVFLLIKR